MRPTDAQLRFLRGLALRTGRSFTPRSQEQAPVKSRRQRSSSYWPPRGRAPLTGSASASRSNETWRTKAAERLASKRTRPPDTDRTVAGAPLSRLGGGGRRRRGERDERDRFPEDHERRPAQRRSDRTRDLHHHEGTEREIIAEPSAGASTLVIDRVAETGADERLVGHLAGDEPPKNAHILCDLYVQSPDRGRCRRVTQEDLLGAPFVVSGEAVEAAPRRADRRGRLHLPAGGGARWARGPRVALATKIGVL